MPRLFGGFALAGWLCRPGCGGQRAWVLERRHLWECSDCHAQTSVTAGTVMHGTRTPLRVWFWAAYLVSTHQPGISAKQLQRQLGLSRYETAWLILQKLRRAMVAPEREPLRTEVEVDEFFLGGLEEGQRGGRQRGKKALCAVAVEVRGRGSGRLRLATLPAASKQSLGGFVKATTALGAIVHTDGWRRPTTVAVARLRASPAQPNGRTRRTAFAPRPPRSVKPKSLAARHPPRRRRSPPAGLPRRVRISPQPPPNAHGRLPDPARPRRRPAAEPPTPR